MAIKRGTIAALAAGAAVAATTTAAALRKTRRLQDEARANGTHVPHGPYEAVVKRPLDAAISALSLVALSPVLAATAVAVRVKLGSPVIFSQERPGKDGDVFRLYKFRSMTNERDENGEYLPDDIRLTKFGRLLRSTSLDELPEFLNILRGEMSFIGPRPLLTSYLPYYSEEEMRRHDVLPGLSGLAQVNGRTSITWEEQFAWDLAYVDKITFIGDLKIVVKTANKVFQRADVVVGSELKVGRLDLERAREACERF